MFILKVEQLETRGLFTVESLKNGLETVWNSSIILSLFFGASVAGALSYFIYFRIIKELNIIKNIFEELVNKKIEEKMSEDDITELNLLSKNCDYMTSSLEDLERRRRELIGDLTHELRTPLTVVRGYLEGLANESIDSSPELYLKLVKETRRLERLIQDIQELFQAETGYLSISLKPLNIIPILITLVERFSEQILDHGPIIKLDSPKDLPLVLGDSDRTEQILVNLLGNAIRYTEKGIITIKVWCEHHRVFVSVIDTGIGIKAENLPYVFERFWSTNESRSRYPGGAGIGLAITRCLVELQGGKIEVVSELGKGSVFTFYLSVA